MKDFGAHVRDRRLSLRERDPAFSLRRVAQRVEVEPSYLSKVERGLEPPPSEATIRLLAHDLDLDPDVLLAMAGKVSEDLQRIIRRRPRLFAELLRELEHAPDATLRRLILAIGRRQH